MPRFDVGVVRVTILVVNLGILVLFGTVSWGFFVGKPDELELELPDETRYAKRESKRTTDSGRAKDVIARLFAVKPPPRPNKTDNKPTKVETPMPTGGPLKEWKILNVITYPTCNVAFVFKGEDPEGDSDKVTSAVKTSKRGRRGRANRRRPSARGGKTKFESMIEGRPFPLDKDIYIQSISREEVVYLDKNGKAYTIVRKNYEVQDYSGGLRGVELEDDALPARGAATEIDEAEKGRIDPGGRKDKSEAKKTTKKKTFKKVDPKAKNK